MSRSAVLSESERLIRSPILIVGGPRSGTTMLGKLIGGHPDVAYWEEPRPIWSQGNAWRRDDRLDQDDLTPEIARRIDDRFHRFLTASGRSRFAEKTPSNCLRLPFIHALYPDARIIHLVRDGRAVVASILRILEKPPDKNRIAARLRETPWRDLPSLAPLFFRDVIARKIRGGQRTFWGPRPPGWRDWLDLPLAVRLARQWCTLETTAREDLARFPDEQRLELRYEDLVADPISSLERIRTVARLDHSSELDEAAASVISPDRVESWKDTLDSTTIAQIEAEAGPLLEELGYPLITGKL